MKKKILITLISALVITGGTISLSAFEAHVVNVTARIENALSVTPEEILFGTVFPQEYLEKSLNISLSSSFLEEDRVDDVEYIIKQKPKPIIPEDAVWCHDNLPDISYDSENQQWIDYLAKCYYPLCYYLSKTPDGEPANDEGILPFHQLTEIALGRLAKSEGDIIDIWTIDLDTPCFKRQCAQDWTHYGWELPPELESEIFGCDLWVEVTGISEVFSPEPTTTGSLAVSLDPNTTPAQTYAKGAIGKEFTKIKLTAGPEEDVIVSNITIRAYEGYGTTVPLTYGNIQNVKIFNSDSVQYGDTIATGDSVMSFNDNLTIAASSAEIITIVADIPISTTASSIHVDLPGSGIVSSDITSTGASSAADITETGSAIGNLMTLADIQNLWTYEQKFNTLSEGDLNGQDSWIGDTCYDVGSTQVYEGTKSIEAAPCGAYKYIDRSGIGCTAGTVYVAIYVDTMGGVNQDAYFILRDDENNKLTDIGFRNYGGTLKIKYSHAGIQQEYLENGVLDTWYVFAIEYNTNTDGKFRVKWKKDGESWSSWTGWKNPFDSSFDGTIDRIRLSSETDYTSYFDTITPIDPTI